MRHVWVICSGLNAAGKRIFFLVLFLVPLCLDVEDVVGNLERQVIRSDPGQLDDHGHVIGLLEDVDRRFDDLVHRGPPGLLVRSHVAERLHLQPRASLRPSKPGPDREPINSFQLILAELLESLKLLAFLGELSEFLDQVGEAVQETAPEIDLFSGWFDSSSSLLDIAPLPPSRKTLAADPRSAPTILDHSITIGRRGPEGSAHRRIRACISESADSRTHFRPSVPQPGHGDVGGKSTLQ